MQPRVTCETWTRKARTAPYVPHLALGLGLGPERTGTWQLGGRTLRGKRVALPRRAAHETLFTINRALDSTLVHCCAPPSQPRAARRCPPRQVPDAALPWECWPAARRCCQRVVVNLTSGRGFNQGTRSVHNRHASAFFNRFPSRAVAHAALRFRTPASRGAPSSPSPLTASPS